VWHDVSMAESESPIRVRLDPDIRERLDRFQLATRRNLTQSVNLLLGSALAMAETQENVDSLFANPKDTTS
jgi:DNA-binding TFAR19-related protein (PDSD5 family)